MKDANPEPTQALVVAEQGSLLPVAEAKQAGPLTPQQARAVEVTEALLPAYQKASTLEMTDSEIEALMAPFPDSDVAIRPHDGLIYLPHILISDRLNRVFKPGKWALVQRRHWLEGSTMYGEYVLLIRGCYVGESIGGHPYQPNNPKVNFSDTLESTAAEALRRIAGKRLSCGSQVWNPDYARNWVDQYAGRDVSGKWFKKAGGANQPQKVVPMPAAAKPASAPKPAAPPETPEQKKTRWAALCKEAGGGNESYAIDLAIEMGWIMEGESIADMSDTYLPKTKKDAEHILAEIRKRAGVAEPPIEVPRDKHADVDSEEAAWRSYPVPFGKHAGIKLADLQKGTLFGFWANFQVEQEYQGKPRKPDQIARDTDFRAALDAAGEHYEFTKPDDTPDDQH